MKKEGEEIETVKDFFNRNPIMDKLIFEDFQNPNMIQVHFPVEISWTVTQAFYRPLRKSSEKYLMLLGERGERIVKGLFAIEGIREVYIGPYNLYLFKGKCFSWEDEIIPQVKKVIRSAL